MAQLANLQTSMSTTNVKKKPFGELILRALILVPLMLAAAGMSNLRAQEQPSAPPPRQTEHTPRRRGPAQELAHETREAAGEEDENAEFKRSASVQAIARLTGLSLNNAFLFSNILNFVVIAALIIWAGRKYLPGIFHDRTAAIQRAMQEAQKASEEARRRLAEIESRLMRLDGEIGMMRNNAEKEAAAEEARIHAAAEEDARKLVELAQQEIAAAAKAARRELTAYAADLAVSLARNQIRVDPATDRTLVRSFADELTSTGGAGKDGN